MKISIFATMVTGASLVHLPLLLLLFSSSNLVAGEVNSSCITSAAMQSDYIKCLKVAYVIAHLNPDQATITGEQAIDELIITAGDQMVVGCTAKLNLTLCLVESACWQCDQMEEAQASEVHFKKALKHFIIPCDWDEANLNVQRCTEAHWKDDQEKKKKWTTTTTATPNTTTTNSTSTPSSANKVTAGIIDWAVLIAIVGSVVVVGELHGLSGSAF